jgi:hypothetical protein
MGGDHGLGFFSQCAINIGNGTRKIKEWIWEKEKAEIKRSTLSTRKEQAGF